jgi:hypothetical protein
MPIMSFSRAKRHSWVKTKQREVIEGCGGYQLREGAAYYKALLEAENDDIGPENTYLWDVKAE